jgi:archaellum component FlaC
MTQANEPDRNRELNWQLRTFDRRIQRPEDTQVTGRELNQSFEHIYQKIDEIDIRIDRLEAKVYNLQTEVSAVNQKVDIIMYHITGLNGQ